MLLQYLSTKRQNKWFAERTDGPLSAIGFRHSDHCCSWKRYDRGVGIVEFSTHNVTQYVSINLTETTEGGKSSKSTSLSLDHDEARQLRDWLNANIKD
jgi:hypothetical protein